MWLFFVAHKSVLVKQTKAVELKLFLNIRCTDSGDYYRWYKVMITSAFNWIIILEEILKLLFYYIGIYSILQ